MSLDSLSINQLKSRPHPCSLERCEGLLQLSKQLQLAGEQTMSNDALSYAGWCDKFHMLLPGISPSNAHALSIHTSRPKGMIAILPEPHPTSIHQGFLALFASLAGGNAALLFLPPHTDTKGELLDTYLLKNSTCNGAIRCLHSPAQEVHRFCLKQAPYLSTFLSPTPLKGLPSYPLSSHPLELFTYTQSIESLSLPIQSPITSTHTY